jgi:hypothetical protein
MSFDLRYFRVIYNNFHSRHINNTSSYKNVEIPRDVCAGSEMRLLVLKPDWKRQNKNKKNEIAIATYIT